jgi:ribosomal protein L37E
MARTHKDPNQYCLSCGHPYGTTDESCTECGFDPINDADDMIRHDKAVKDFHDWENSGRDGR